MCLSLVLVALGVAIVLLVWGLRIVQEYERAVVFRLGRLAGIRGPGLFFIIPWLERIQTVDLRLVTIDIPPQEVITRDNVSIKVNAVLYFQINDASLAVTRVKDYTESAFQIAQTTLRSVMGQSELDELLAQREEINNKLRHIIDEQTECWGVKVTLVEVKDVELPESMQRAMAKQAEAEREKRAKIIHAEGELLAAQQLVEAASVMVSQPVSFQLRYLQTLGEIAAEKNSTILFPLPLEQMSSVVSKLTALADGASEPKKVTAARRKGRSSGN